MLFKYGARIQPDLVVDLECTKILLRTGAAGNASQLDVFAWYYHPAVQPTGRHPIVKNLDRVEFKFCSSIDTIRTKTPVKKTVLLTSSKYNRLQFSPIELTFEEILRQKSQTRRSSTKERSRGGAAGRHIPIQLRKPRVGTNAGRAAPTRRGVQTLSEPTRMLVISDGDVAANVVRNPATEDWLPLGLNRADQTTYANKELMLNAVMHNLGVIEARTKE